VKNLNKILCIAAVLLAAVIVLPAVSYAQEDVSFSDLREELNNMNLTSGEKYFEMDEARRYAILMLYTIEGVNVSSDVKQFVFSVKDFLDTFESAYRKSKTGSVSDHRENIPRGSDMKRMALSLNPYKNNPQVKDYAQVTTIVDDLNFVVKRFLDDEGAYFEEKAEYENITPIKLWHLEDSASAYVESENNAKIDEVNEKHDELKSEFTKEMEAAGMEKSDADLLLNKSDELKDSQNILDLFSAFISSTQARLKYADIEKVYIGHNLDSAGCAENMKCAHEYYETFLDAGNKKAYSSEISDSLMGVILKYLAIIAFIILVLLFIFKRSYSSYKADINDSKLGVELGLDKFK